MSRIEKLRVSGQIVFLAIAGAACLTLCAGGPGHALNRTSLPPPPLLRPSPSSQSYLLCVGPPNLRFESSQVRVKKNAPMQNSQAKPSAEATKLAGNAADATNNVPMPTNAAPMTAVVTKADSRPASASSFPFSLESDRADPAIVTPAMLAEFLKSSTPGKDSRIKNVGSPGAAVPPNLGFKPPMPAADNSRGVNKSQ